MMTARGPLQRLLNFYRMPVVDDADLRARLRIFFSIFYVLIIPLPFYLILLIFDDEPLARKLTLFGFTLAFFVFMNAMVWLAHRGRVQLAVAILLGYIWLSLAAQLLIGHVDLRAPNYSWFLILIIIAGLLIGNWGTAVYVVLSIALLTVLLGLQLTETWQFNMVTPVFGYVMHSISYIVGGVFVGVAVREGRIALKRARRSEARWRALVENAPDDIIQLNTDLTIAYINKADATPARADLVGRRFLDVLPAEYHATVAHILYNSLQTGKADAVQVQTSTFAASDAPRWYTLTASPISADDTVMSMVVQLHDVTSAKIAEQSTRDLELAQARNAALETAMDELSHDLKTPLATLMTSVYLLRRQVDPSEEIPRFDTINRHVENLSQMVNDLLTMARLEQIDRTLFEAVDASVLLAQVGDEMRQLATDRQVALRTEATDAARVFGIESELMRALRNLVDNALYYTPHGGDVWLRVFAEGDTVVIEVQDNGVGIGSKELPRVFDTYFRTKQSEQMRANGSGLGLAIVQKVVDLHDGRIDVESQPGHGTQFRIQLPKLDDTEQPQPA